MIQRILVNKFLQTFSLSERNKKKSYFYTKTICCGYSKEPSRWDGTFEHLKHGKTDG